MRWVVGLITVFLMASVGYAAEEIERYDSDITVRADGVVEIVETITVRAEGRDIRRGIFRDFPTDYKDSRGNAISMGFEVVSVKRDGIAEPYSVRAYQNGKRVRIGSADHLLNRGSHTYEIAYETTWQITHLTETDELYFNAIGHGWQFPILAGSARVRVPDGANIGRTKATAGRSGVVNGDITPERLTANELVFELPRRLSRNEGLTILVEWPTGFVARPSGADKAERFLSDNGWIGVGGVALGILFLFLFGMWKQVGKDPKAGAIIARYNAPDGPYGEMSPALCRFIMKKKSDETAFTAAIISMAAKGFIEIKETDDGILLTRVATGVSLSKGEAAIAAHLFYNEGDSFHIRKKYDQTFAGAVKKFSFAVGRGEGKYFKRNLTPIGAGLGFFVACMVVTVIASANLLFGLVGLLILGGVAWWGLSVIAKSGDGEGFGIVVAAILLTAFGAFGGALLIDGEIFLAAGMIGYFLAGFLLCGIFSLIMGRRTPYGRQLLDEIEGLKLYMSVAEKDRLDFHNPPERTPEHFEALLPYAIALGVENRWGDQFDDILSKAASARGAEHYSPSWYHGRRGGFSRSG
ncbi:MAG: DUF2207 domain-containing protein, partial [Alphaproteobacteria bacterium]|nr:DUF2207 domain-containing protein [Alphaproteobacteria bacterium]